MWSSVFKNSAWLFRNHLRSLTYLLYSDKLLILLNPRKVHQIHEQVAEKLYFSSPSERRFVPRIMDAQILPRAKTNFNSEYTRSHFPEHTRLQSNCLR